MSEGRIEQVIEWRPISEAPHDRYLLLACPRSDDDFRRKKRSRVVEGRWGATQYNRSLKKYNQGWIIGASYEVHHDEDSMEPLTVLHVPFGPEMWRQIKHGMPYRMPVRLPLSIARPDDEITERTIIPVVTMRFEPIYREGKPWFWMALTRDGENALNLRSVFLPGQQRDVRAAYERGFVDGIAALLGK